MSRKNCGIEFNFKLNAVSLADSFVFIEEPALFNPVSPWEFYSGADRFGCLNKYGLNFFKVTPPPRTIITRGV